MTPITPRPSAEGTRPRSAATDIHSCGYFCDRPECIKAQRDELRERVAELEPVGWQWITTAQFRRNLPENAEAGAWRRIYAMKE